MYASSSVLGSTFRNSYISLFPLSSVPPFGCSHLPKPSFIGTSCLSSGPLHTRDWEPMTITLPALSLVEKAEPVQVRYLTLHFLTLRLRDQRSKRMQDGCRVYMESYMPSNGSCFLGHLDYFQKPPLGGRSNTKHGDHGTPNAHNRWFIPFFYHNWGSEWIKTHWNSIWLRTRSHMPSQYTWESMTTLHDFGGVLGWPLNTLFWALTVSWSQLLARVWSGPQSSVSPI